MQAILVCILLAFWTYLAVDDFTFSFKVFDQVLESHFALSIPDAVFNGASHSDNIIVGFHQLLVYHWCKKVAFRLLLAFGTLIQILILLHYIVYTQVAVYLIAISALSWVIDNGFANRAFEEIENFSFIFIEFYRSQGLLD
jgi:hypothetical protein